MSLFNKDQNVSVPVEITWLLLKQQDIKNTDKNDNYFKECIELVDDMVV